MIQHETTLRLRALRRPVSLALAAASTPIGIPCKVKELGPRALPRGPNTTSALALMRRSDDHGYTDK